MPPRKEALLRKQEGLKLLSLDVPPAKVAARLGVTERAVRYWRREAKVYADLHRAS